MGVALGQGPLPLPQGVNEGWDGSIYQLFHSIQSPTHSGLDLWVAGHGEQPVYANIPGIIQSVGTDCNHVTIEIRRPDLGFNANVGMGHLTRVVVAQGQKVEKGEIIGYINPDLFNGTRQVPGKITIACTTQPHVHYDVWMPIGYPQEAWSDTWDMYDPSLLSPKKGDPRPLH